MSISLSENFHASLGGKMFRLFACSLEAGSNAISAASLDLAFIESSWLCPTKQTLSAGSTSGMVLKHSSASTGITISGVDTTADACIIGVIGW